MLSSSAAMTGRKRHVFVLKLMVGVFEGIYHLERRKRESGGGTKSHGAGAVNSGFFEKNGGGQWWKEHRAKCKHRRRRVKNCQNNSFPFHSVVLRQFRANSTGGIEAMVIVLYMISCMYECASPNSMNSCEKQIEPPPLHPSSSSVHLYTTLSTPSQATIRICCVPKPSENTPVSPHPTLPKTGFHGEVETYNMTETRVQNVKPRPVVSSKKAVAERRDTATQQTSRNAEPCGYRPRGHPPTPPPVGRWASPLLQPTKVPTKGD